MIHSNVLVNPAMLIILIKPRYKLKSVGGQTCLVKKPSQSECLQYFPMKDQPACPCTLVTPGTDRYVSVTKSDFLAPPASVPSNNHRSLTFCTPVVDTGGCIEVTRGDLSPLN